MTYVLEGGEVLEKAAANVSVINGTLNAERARTMTDRGRPGVNPDGGDPFTAIAFSLVFHSASPFIPTLRADVRVFEVLHPAPPQISTASAPQSRCTDAQQ